MTTEPDVADGAITLPRRASFWAACGVVVTLASQLFLAGSYATSVDNRLNNLGTEDRRIVARLESLQRDRDRLPKLEERFGRVEEKVTMMLDLLRETRQERQGKRG